MKLNELVSSGALSQTSKCKVLVYGAPGTGKTPAMTGCPNPIALVCEPGLASMRGTNVPVCIAETPARIEDFLAWLYSSNEAKQFETVAIDSVSQMAEIYLAAAESKNNDGRAAYGVLAKNMLKVLNALFYQTQFHTYLIAKMSIGNGKELKHRPYFPGNELNIKVPHMYDCILYASKQIVPGQGNDPIPTLQTSETFEFVARDRLGKLEKMEPFNMNYIFNKLLS